MSEEKKEETLETPAEAKKKKISRMSLADVEKALKSAQEKMGGVSSKYALKLQQRKDVLSAGK